MLNRSQAVPIPMVMRTPLATVVQRASSLMSDEQLKAFLDKAQVDARLRQKLQLASDADAVIALAVEAGFATSLEQLNRPHSVRTELPDDLLEGVAAGVSRDRWKPGF